MTNKEKHIRQLYQIITQAIVMVCFVAAFSSSSSVVYAQSAFDDPGARAASGQAGDLKVVDGKIDAGTVTLGSSSQVVILLKNESSKPIISADISLYPSSNVSASVGENECNKQPLSPEAVCAIALSVKGLQLGNFRVEMLLRHDGRSKLVTATVAGDVDSSGDQTRDVINDIEAIPATLNFGSLKESRPLTQSLVLRNVTSKEITINGIDIESNEAAGYSMKSTCDSLLSGEACVATVTWAPQQRGPATGALVVNHTGPSSVVSVILDGEYQPEQAKEVGVFPEAVPGKGLLTASQREIDFGTGIESESAITISLVNVGDEPLEIENISLADKNNGIEILATGCRPAKTLLPVEACPLTLKWQPVRVGNILDDVQVRHSGARGILVLPIRGGAAKAVNRDNQSVLVGDGESFFADVPKISAAELGDVSSPSSSSLPAKKNVGGALEGYRITSLASNRAIIAGPGGSRVVLNREETVIGGVLWKVFVKSSAVEFVNGKQRVILLFDRSLSTSSTGEPNQTVTTTDIEGGT